MKTITNNFKEEIAKLGREIDFKIFLYDNYKLTAEDSKLLITEDYLNIVTEQFNTDEAIETIDSENIYNISIINKGTLLSTLMKELDFEIVDDLKVGSLISGSFGLKVGDEYEYVNYGKYIIYSKEKNEDTNTYSYVAFDSMLLSMVEVDDTSIIQNVTVQQAIENICDKVGLKVNITAQDIENYPNLENVINEKAFTNVEMTYRDVLDIICQALGLSMIVEDRELKLKALNNNIVDTFDGNYLKDTNVKFSDKYIINSVVLSRSEDNDTIYRRDEESVAENGVHEFKIKDNLIMQYDDREDYIDEIFEQLNGLEFYINDFESTGITYLDWLDFYNIEIDGNIYKCLMLNDEIKVQQGLSETIYTEMPEETVTDYKTSSKTDKEVSFIVDKQNGEIKSKVTQGEMESYVSEVADEITAQVSEKVGEDEIIAKLNLAVRDGQGIVNLVGNTVTIESDKFTLDKNGNITATSGTFGGTVNTSQDLTVGNNAYIGQNQSSSALDQKFIYFSDLTYLRRIRLLDGTENLGIESQYITIKPLQTFSVSINNDSLFSVFKGNDGLHISNYVDYYYIESPNIYFSSQPTIGSDKRLKNNIKNIKVDWIDKLKVKEFEYNKSPNIKQIGLIAQDYINEDYSKYFINKNEDGYYSVCYGNITNALIQYCQEMKKEINSLKEEIRKLKESDK